MAITVYKLIDLILIMAAAVVVFGVIAVFYTAFTGEMWACRLSVSMVSLNVADSINCRIVNDTISVRDFERERADRVLAEHMLECHSVYQANRNTPLRSHDLVDVGSAPMSILSGNWPGGRLFDSDYFEGPENELMGFIHGVHVNENLQFCSICKIVELPPDQEIRGFRDALVSEYYRGWAFSENLYGEPGSTKYDHYFNRNSDAFMPFTGDSTPVEPARAVIFYTEGRVDGQDVLGVVAMNLSDFHTTVTNPERKDNLCQVYLT